MELDMNGAPNAGSDASMVMDPPIDMGIVDSMEEVPRVIINCARTMWSAIDDHSEKESLEMVAAPPIVVDTFQTLAYRL